MAEGVAVSGAVVAEGVRDDPAHTPAPDAVAAPRGWTWDRSNKCWKPKQRGPLLAAAPADPAPGAVQHEHRDQAADPAPGWEQPPGEVTTVTPLPVLQPLSDSDRADVKALVALCYTVPGEALPLLDPYCFGPLAEPATATAVITAVSDIVCQSPRVAQWAVSAGGLMPWLRLALALKPVAIAVLHHHILRDTDVEVDRDAKTVTVTRQDWTQYPAA